MLRNVNFYTAIQIERAPFSAKPAIPRPHTENETEKKAMCKRTYVLINDSRRPAAN